MSIIDKHIVDYWRKDVNMRLMVEKSCAKDIQNGIYIKRLNGLKTMLKFYSDNHKDLMAKELIEHKNQQEHEHYSNS